MASLSTGQHCVNQAKDAPAFLNDLPERCLRNGKVYNGTDKIVEANPHARQKQTHQALDTGI